MKFSKKRDKTSSSNSLGAKKKKLTVPSNTPSRQSQGKKKTTILSVWKKDADKYIPRVMIKHIADLDVHRPIWTDQHVARRSFDHRIHHLLLRIQSTQWIGVRQRSRFPANHRFVSSSTTLYSPSCSPSNGRSKTRSRAPNLPFSPFLFLSPIAGSAFSVQAHFPFFFYSSKINIKNKFPSYYSSQLLFYPPFWVDFHLRCRGSPVNLTSKTFHRNVN